MADIKKSVNLLPEYLRTDKNSKFLSSTIDQLIQTPQVDRVDGYVGSKITPNYNPVTDFYINELSSLRNSYSLEPSLVFKDSTNNITDVIAYDDLINELGIQGGKNTNLDTLFRSKFYSFDPLIDWDKLINYTEYYWLPQGPELITLDDERIGYFRLSNYSDVNKNIYIGADISPKFKGKGLGKLSYEKFIPFLFESYDLNKISLEVLSNNIIALNLYKKLGFVTEGVKRQEVYKNNQWIDSIIMSILKNEYE